MALAESISKWGRTILRKHFYAVILWSGFFLVALLVYLFLSEGAWGFILSLSAFQRCFGFALLNYKMFTTFSAKSISAKTLEIYVLVFILRLIGVRYQGYLPNDKTGDWFYHLCELLSLAFIAVALFGIWKPLRSTYQEQADNFGNLYIPSPLGALYIVVPCAVLAIFIHPTHNLDFLSDTFWTWSMNLEAVAMLPQIYMFQRQSTEQGGSLEALIGHTMFAISFSRILEFVFWGSCFRELVDNNGWHLPGIIIMLSQVCHLLIMGDFFYYYVQYLFKGSFAKGLPMTLPSGGSYSSSLV